MNVPSILLIISSLSSLISRAFAQGVCPEVIGQSASESLSLSFNGQSIADGSTVTPSTASVEPELEWLSESGVYYSVMMVDPDAPSPDDPSSAQWLHWAVINIPGDGSLLNSLDGGRAMISYAGPSPPAGSGDHRYCTYVFKQSEYNVLMAGLSEWTARAHFDVYRTLETFFPAAELVADHHFISSH